MLYEDPFATTVFPLGDTTDPPGASADARPEELSARTPAANEATATTAAMPTSCPPRLPTSQHDNRPFGSGAKTDHVGSWHDSGRAAPRSFHPGRHAGGDRGREHCACADP